jgi:hypothetical protein
MKKVVLAIVMFAIGIGLIVGVIVPLATHGRNTGIAAESRMDGIDDSINGIDETIH